MVGRAADRLVGRPVATGIYGAHVRRLLRPISSFTDRLARVDSTRGSARRTLHARARRTHYGEGPDTDSVDPARAAGRCCGRRSASSAGRTGTHLPATMGAEGPSRSVIARTTSLNR